MPDRGMKDPVLSRPAGRMDKWSTESRSLFIKTKGCCPVKFPSVLSNSWFPRHAGYAYVICTVLIPVKSGIWTALSRIILLHLLITPILKYMFSPFSKLETPLGSFADDAQKAAWTLRPCFFGIKSELDEDEHSTEMILPFCIKHWLPNSSAKMLYFATNFSVGDLSLDEERDIAMILFRILRTREH
jgi:predicted class III extradiol MEMO1 family dioxygenase